MNAVFIFNVVFGAFHEVGVHDYKKYDIMVLLKLFECGFSETMS
jgi:hypothetical protein